MPGYIGPASFDYTVSDDQGDSALATVNLTVGSPATTLSLFSDAEIPAVLSSDDTGQLTSAFSLSLSDSGAITGIKFYKGLGDTGTHVGSLWTSDGTLLASATFTKETATGWQAVTFSNPVEITAGATYVASYHSNGHYAVTRNYFTTALTNGLLTAPADTNGLFTYGTSNAFPTSTYGAGNYWVDVLFNPDPNQLPVATDDSGFTTSQDISLSIAASSLLANDSDPDGDPLTISDVGGSSGGTVNYNSQTNLVTFTPTAGYIGPASFDYTVSDGQGGAATATASIDVGLPIAGQDFFSDSLSTLDNTTVSDPNPIELGFKFQSDVAGTISAIQFYKGPSNTGSHDVNLWTSTGTPLASASSTDEFC